MWKSFLPAVSAQQPFESSVFEVEGLGVQMDIRNQGPVGCSFTRLVVWANHALPVDLGRLGEETVSRVTYLLEPLRLVEVAPRLGYAQIRSTRPSVRNGRREYYEAVSNQLASGHCVLTLARYRMVKGNRQRTAVPINLTWEALERLLEDLSLAFRNVAHT
ncbi:MAG: hypothetical protein GXP41_05905 [Chloroflexi bacterium]|nr:hypothetical protein [Chloroflexota bacterium]